MRSVLPFLVLGLSSFVAAKDGGGHVSQLLRLTCRGEEPLTVIVHNIGQRRQWQQRILRLCQLDGLSRQPDSHRDYCLRCRCQLELVIERHHRHGVRDLHVHQRGGEWLDHDM